MLISKRVMSLGTESAFEVLGQAEQLKQAEISLILVLDSLILKPLKILLRRP